MGRPRLRLGNVIGSENFFYVIEPKSFIDLKNGYEFQPYHPIVLYCRRTKVRNIVPLSLSDDASANSSGST